MATATTTRTNAYTRVTSHIVEELERGVRPWLKPWNAENAAGHITRPLRHNGQPYNGVNILMLWASAEVQGYRSSVRKASISCKDYAALFTLALLLRRMRRGIAYDGST